MKAHACAIPRGPAARGEQGARVRGRWFARVAGCVALASLAACGSLFGPAPPAPRSWLLDGIAAGRAGAQASATAPLPAPAPAAGASAPVVLVSIPRAAAGFDTDRLLYVGEAHRLEPYSENQWVDTPARMLQPLLAEALGRTGAFGVVLTSPSPAHGAWQFDTLVVRLQHEVPDARVRFTLRATLIDPSHRTAVASREFDATAPTPSATPAGAVAAANAAAADVLSQVAAWCVGTVRAYAPS